jgi:hypothetical protein
MESRWHPLARFTPRRPWVVPVSTAYKDFLKDLLAGFGPVSIRNMFSGAGIYTRVPAGESPKRRRFLVRAIALLAERMTARAVLLDQHLALVDEGLLGGVSGNGEAENEDEPHDRCTPRCVQAAWWHRVLLLLRRFDN